jgi:predicted O-methyltransferase YrrM
MDYMYQTSIHTFPEEAAQMVTPVQARFLTLLVRLVGARKILEIGSLMGFSTLALAEGCKDLEGANVIGLEKDLIHAKLARKHIDMAKLTDLIEIRVGPALQLCVLSRGNSFRHDSTR